MTTPSRDVRHGERWTWPQRIKNDILYALISGLATTVPRLPKNVLRTLGRGVASLFYLFATRARSTAHENLARALPSTTPEARRALAWRSYQLLGSLLGDTVAALDPRHPHVPLPFAHGARSVFEDALTEGRGVIFVSAHLGPWELVASSLVAHGIPLVVIARESYDPRLSALYDRLRGSRNVRVIYRGHPSAVARIARSLRKGEVVGAPMDLRSRVASCDAPFLGSSAKTPIGPARLALRTGAAVIVGTAERRDDGVITISARRIQTEDLANSRTHIAESTLALTTRINDELSRRILTWPEAWVWMHDRWASKG